MYNTEIENCVIKFYCDISEGGGKNYIKIGVNRDSNILNMLLHCLSLRYLINE